MTWWQASCFYQVYVSRFQDSNDDGVGDLDGITSRLPYLQALGVDAIWITPFYPSPDVDFGRDATTVREIVGHERACDGRWPSLVLSNHDIDRTCDRFAHGDEPDAVARLLATLLLMLRGTPFAYYGEEMAMRTEPPASLEEVCDPVGRRFWPLYKGRDGVRRPMAWDGSPGSGFTRSTPWLGISRDSDERNVHRQAADPDSVLNFYRSLLRVRRASGALVSGQFQALDSPAGVLAYARTNRSDELIVVLNFTDRIQDAILPAAASGRSTVVFGSHRRATRLSRVAFTRSSR